ncbi:MAG: anti-sigma factor antagonist, partial [Mucispirillum sp.]|nr:anti-sigma factor antagonist [Mucispirillum sp.]
MSFKNQREAINDTIKAEFIFPIHEIDSFNGGELKNYIISAADEVDGVVINFSDITYLNSSGLR